jgi:hypothetical protein
LGKGEGKVVPVVSMVAVAASLSVEEEDRFPLLPGPGVAPLEEAERRVGRSKGKRAEKFQAGF